MASKSEQSPQAGQLGAASAPPIRDRKRPSIFNTSRADLSSLIDDGGRQCWLSGPLVSPSVPIDRPAIGARAATRPARRPASRRIWAASSRRGAAARSTGGRLGAAPNCGLMRAAAGRPASRFVCSARRRRCWCHFRPEAAPLMFQSAGPSKLIIVFGLANRAQVWPL